jgi:hypothetical protein
MNPDIKMKYHLASPAELTKRSGVSRTGEINRPAGEVYEPHCVLQTLHAY